MNDLKPCPFCGGRAKAAEHEGVPIARQTYWSVSCQACHITIAKQWTRETVEGNWNTRAALTAAPASAAEPTAIDALQAIADLPTGKNLDVMTGHEDAYRAIEKLFPSPPYIAAHEERVDTILDTILADTGPLSAEDEENVRQFDAVVAKASATVSRRKRWASDLTDDELLAEMAELEAKIANGFGEHGGSPGEWYYERADEVKREIDKRVTSRLTIDT